MRPVARSARSQRRRYANLLSGEPQVAPIGAPGAREIVLDHPVEHDENCYRTLNIRPPSIVDFAKMTRFAKGRLDQGVTLVALCCDMPKEALLKLSERDQHKIGQFMQSYLAN